MFFVIIHTQLVNIHDCIKYVDNQKLCYQSNTFTWSTLHTKHTRSEDNCPTPYLKSVLIHFCVVGQMLVCLKSKLLPTDEDAALKSETEWMVLWIWPVLHIWQEIRKGENNGMIRPVHITCIYLKGSGSRLGSFRALSSLHLFFILFSFLLQNKYGRFLKTFLCQTEGNLKSDPG